MVCQVCHKAWPADTSICPDDGTWLHDETIMDERGRTRAASKGDMFAPESNSRRSRELAVTGDGRTQPLTVPQLPGELGPGTRVGDYEIESKIGEGAMGAVYRAVHPAIGRSVAIKVMTPKLFDEPESVKRFVAEARAVAAIRHPGIVDIFGFGRLPDGRTYLVMEWLEGTSLGSELKQGKVGYPEACDLIRQIARALEAAHGKGIIHRDLKPENVFLHHIEDEKPIAKLLDFGLAKVTNKEDGLVARTRTGQMLGTPLYMSPEQCKSKGVDHRTDIYALGCMAYEMLCGRVPFDADNVAELVSAHLVMDPPRPSKLNPKLPPELDDLLFRMIAKDPAQRPTLAEVRRTISQSLSRPTPTSVAVAEDPTPPPFTPENVPSPPPWLSTPLPWNPTPPPGSLHMPATSTHGSGGYVPPGSGHAPGSGVYSPVSGPPPEVVVPAIYAPQPPASGKVAFPWLGILGALVIIGIAVAAILMLR